MGMHIVITGNPVDGFFYYGIFATGVEAAEWAQEELDQEWWIAPLASPNI